MSAKLLGKQAHILIAAAILGWLLGGIMIGLGDTIHYYHNSDSVMHSLCSTEKDLPKERLRIATTFDYDWSVDNSKLQKTHGITIEPTPVYTGDHIKVYRTRAPTPAKITLLPYSHYE